jgi:hypothetical protein
MTTQTPIRADLAMAHTIANLITAKQIVAQAITSRGNWEDLPMTEDSLDLTEIYFRVSDLLAYCERKRKISMERN